METHSSRRDDAHGSQLTTGTLVAAALAVCIGQVALSIPAVLNGLFQQDLGTTSSQLTWVSDAFLVPVTLFELTFGVLGDLFGRKRLLVLGALAVTVGEVVCVLVPGAGTATSTRVLVMWIGQAIAGIGCAALFPTSLAMIAAGTRTARERGRSIAIWAAALSGGNVVSPVLGGLVVRIAWGSDPSASWRWACVLIAVLSAVSLAVSLRFARDSSAPEGRSLDWPGQITIAVALFALLFAIIQAASAGWGSAQVLIGFVVAAVFLGLFVVAEQRSPAPLLRLDLFANRSFAVTAIITVTGMFALLGSGYATSVRLTAIQQFSPLKASIGFVFFYGLTCAQVPFTMRVLPRWSPRWMLCIGFGFIAGGAFWMSQLSATDLSIAPVILPMSVIGFGFAFALSSITAVAVNSVPVNLAGMASGATSMLRDFGFTLGPALVGALALSQAASKVKSSIAASPHLQHALKTFYALPAHVPHTQQAMVAKAVAAVRSGPLGANSVPPTAAGKPFNPLHSVAFHALDHAYRTGYGVCAGAALLSCLLAAVALGGLREGEEPVEEMVGAHSPSDGRVQKDTQDSARGAGEVSAPRATRSPAA